MSAVIAQGGVPLRVEPVQEPSSRIARLLLPRHALVLFTSAVAITYGLVPLIVYYFVLPLSQYAQLAGLTAIAVAGLIVGGRIPLLDRRFGTSSRRFMMPGAAFHVLVWVGFGVFLIATFASAQTIPILSAFQGATPEDLSWERGLFLKGRQGAGLALLYVSTVFVSTLLPYSMIHLYKGRSPFRHLCALLFLAFCLSFLQKTLFFTLALPMVAYLAVSRQLSNRRILMWSGVVSALILIQMYLSLDIEVLASTSYAPSFADVLAADYVPRNPIMYTLWRALAVPVFTAADTLVVHATYFDGRPLLGATSTVLALLFGIERINLERFVSEYQFGGWNDIANSNAVFLVDAYANFGYLGVLVFAILVGQAFRLFRLSRDVGFSSLWPLFAYGLFNASLIGMLLSNGYLYMLWHGTFVKLSGERLPVRESPPAEPTGARNLAKRRASQPAGLGESSA